MNRSNLVVLSLAVLATALITYLFLGRSGDSAPAAQRPVGPVVGSYPHSRAKLVGLRRTGPKIVTARLSVTLDRMAPDDWLPDLEGPDGTWYTAQGLRLVDEFNGREQHPLKDADGNCLCSTDIDHLEPGDSIGVSAMFPAPPPNVHRASLHVPGFPSFDDVPLQPLDA
jgi:hypothetical protein